MGNFESIGKMPASVLMAASTLTPDLKECWRKNEFLGNICPIKSFKTSSPMLPLSLGERKNSFSSLIDLDTSLNSPASFLRSPITLVALSSLMFISLEESCKLLTRCWLEF